MKSLRISPAGKTLIRVAMQSQKITQTQLADKLGVSRQTTSAFLNGHQAILADTVHRLCNLLEIDVSAAADEADLVTPEGQLIKQDKTATISDREMLMMLLNKVGQIAFFDASEIAWTIPSSARIFDFDSTLPEFDAWFFISKTSVRISAFLSSQGVSGEDERLSMAFAWSEFQFAHIQPVLMQIVSKLALITSDR